MRSNNQSASNLQATSNSIQVEQVVEYDLPLKVATQLFTECTEIAESDSARLNQAEQQAVNSLRAANTLSRPEQYHAFTKGFELLGDIYRDRGALLGDNRQQLKAVTLYNLALASDSLPHRQKEKSILPEHILLSETQKQLIEKIQGIEVSLTRAYGGEVLKQTSQQYWQMNESAKATLKQIRQQAQRELKQATRVQTIYQHIATGLKDRLAKSLLEHCMDKLPVPEGCQYAIIALGSLARAEATPYSDFEFAVLIQDQGADKNKKHKEYFRQLTHLFWIKVLNLGETTARMMDISSLSWMAESKSPTRKGFSFDGQMESGCHTPLGNMHHTEVKNKYELIGTPQELAQFQTDDWFKRKRALTTVLSTIESILYNDSSLVQSYEAQVVKIHNQVLPASERTRIQERSINLLRESCEKFKFRGGRFAKEAHYFDAKYHLYRLPNMLLDHLVGYFGVKAKSLWERIEKLFGKNGVVENELGAQNLNRAISDILALRLLTYLKKGYRDDRILMFDPEQPEKNLAMLSQYFSLDKARLFSIYHVLIPLQWTIERFIEQGGQPEVLISSYYYNNSQFTEGYIHDLLLDYKQAALAYEKDKALKIATHGEQHIAVANTLTNLGAVYEAQSRYADALDVYEQAKQIIAALHHSGRHISLADILHNMGNVYQHQDRYAEALEAYEQAKQIKIATHGAQHISVAETLNSMGLVYVTRCHYTEALGAYEQAKRTKIATYGKQHTSIANTLHNIGTVYEVQGHYDKALEVYEQAKQIMMAIYGELHIMVAFMLNNMGIVYEAQGRYVEALEMYEQAKRIRITTHGEQHISVAKTLNNMGNVYWRQGHYTDALEMYEQAKRIRIATHGEQHTAVAETYNNIGNVYAARGRYVEALEMYEQAKQIRIATHGEQHIVVAETLANMGNVYAKQGRYAEALEVYVQAKRIRIATHGEQHIVVADTLTNIGRVYVEQQQFEQARFCYQQALKCYEHVELPQRQTLEENLVNSYIREGNSWILQSRMDKARACYEKAGLSADFTQLEWHVEQASRAYQQNQLPTACEHLQICIKLKPNSALIYHSLARLTHTRAQLVKENGDEENYLACLKEADVYFQRVIELEADADTYTEYAQFMLRNYSHYSLDSIIDYLLKAIEQLGANAERYTEYAQFILRNYSDDSLDSIIDYLLKTIQLDQQDNRLSYSVIDRITVDAGLQAFIDHDQHHNILLSAHLLAHYLLVQVYLLKGENQKAQSIFKRLQANADKFKWVYGAIIEKLKRFWSLELEFATVPTDKRDQQLTLEAIEKVKGLVDELVQLTDQLIQSPKGELAVRILQRETFQVLTRSVENKTISESESSHATLNRSQLFFFSSQSNLSTHPTIPAELHENKDSTCEETPEAVNEDQPNKLSPK